MFFIVMTIRYYILQIRLIHLLCHSDHRAHKGCERFFKTQYEFGYPFQGQGHASICICQLGQMNRNCSFKLEDVAHYVTDPPALSRSKLFVFFDLFVLSR